MAGNPFTYYSRPATPREAQSNANHAHYELMAARDMLREFDQSGIKAPHAVVSDANTMGWAAREEARLVRKSVTREAA